MPSLLDRVRERLSPAARADRRNVASLARRLDLSDHEAEVLYRRAREVGFGAAMAELDDRSRDRKAG